MMQMMTETAPHRAVQPAARCRPNCDANDASPVGADRAEDVSFSKVHRGDKTPVELFVAGITEIAACIRELVLSLWTASAVPVPCPG